MNSPYTIIIPIFNEAEAIPDLLQDLKLFKAQGHEILIVNDGSDDDSHQILSRCKFISLIHLKKNFGKGIAIRNGIEKALNEKLILFDGDRELNTKEIHNLMVLDEKKKVRLVFANRIMLHTYTNFMWIIGNKILTSIFNIIHKSNLKDALCCAKAFYKSDLNINSLKADKFDIDVEIACNLVKKHNSYNTIPLEYCRRNRRQGKKLRLRDSLSILLKILKC